MWCTGAREMYYEHMKATEKLTQDVKQMRNDTTSNVISTHIWIWKTSQENRPDI